MATIALAAASSVLSALFLPRAPRAFLAARGFCPAGPKGVLAAFGAVELVMLCVAETARLCADSEPRRLK